MIKKNETNATKKATPAAPASLAHGMKKNETDTEVEVAAPKAKKNNGWDIKTSTINELNASIQPQFDGVPDT